MKTIAIIIILAIVAFIGIYFNYMLAKSACKNCPVKKQCDLSIECGEKALCEDDE